MIWDMGFNKKLLDHFSEMLRCNQYPKRYRGDKAKIYETFVENDTFCLLHQLGDMILNFREHRKGKHFDLPDNASRMHFMVHLWHHTWWKENVRKATVELTCSSTSVSDWARLRFLSASESKSPDERSKMREWSF